MHTSKRLLAARGLHANIPSQHAMPPTWYRRMRCSNRLRV